MLKKEKKKNGDETIDKTSKIYLESVFFYCYWSQIALIIGLHRVNNVSSPLSLLFPFNPFSTE